MKASVICDQFEVAVVPFPFLERPVEKRRPAVVLSTAGFNASGHTVMAMITSAKGSRWASDIVIRDLNSAGLSAACIIRLKLFTLDNRVIERRAGKLELNDAKRLLQKLRMYILAPG